RPLQYSINETKCRGRSSAPKRRRMRLVLMIEDWPFIRATHIFPTVPAREIIISSSCTEYADRVSYLSVVIHMRKGRNIRPSVEILSIFQTGTPDSTSSSFFNALPNGPHLVPSLGLT